MIPTKQNESTVCQLIIILLFLDMSVWNIFQKKEILSFWESHSHQPLTGRNQILTSFCPQVYGLYVVKLAVAMALAGGVQVGSYIGIFGLV